MKRWQTFEHPSDLGLEAWADDLASLLEALGDALAHQICQAGEIRSQERVELEVSADNLDSLVVEYLSHLLRLFTVRRLVIGQVEVVAASGTSVKAIVWAEPVDIARHEIGPEIKAITYHQLLIDQRDGQWHGRVLLDL